MASPTIARRYTGAHPTDPTAPFRTPPAARSATSGRGRRRVALALASAALAFVSLAPAAFAVDPTPPPVPPLLMTTAYPSVVVAPGAHVSLTVTIKTPTAQRVALSLTGAPASWRAAMHGGGFVVDAVETNGTDTTSVRVDVIVPADATGTTSMVLKGSTPTTTVELPLEVRIDPTATGDVTLKTDFPSLRGPSTQNFNFNLTISNGTSEDQTFSVNAQGPTGWTVTANLTGQAQAASAVVKAGSSSGVTVSAIPPDGVDAGTYNIDVVALAGDRPIKGQLQVEVTGTYTFSLATTDGRLNGHGSAGAETPLSIVLTNTGTADITNVKLSGTQPSGWSITFDQPTVATIPAKGTVTVTAQIKPSGDAIAGDYPITIAAKGDNSSRESMEIRYTVETSLVWGIIGAGLIVAVGAGIWFVFQRYGRR